MEDNKYEDSMNQYLRESEAIDFLYKGTSQSIDEISKKLNPKQLEYGR